MTTDDLLDIDEGEMERLKELQVNLFFDII